MAIPFMHVRRQFSLDIDGKDSFRGASLSYAWMANQTGHILLGLVTSALFYLLLWTIFEVTNWSWLTVDNMTKLAVTLMIITWLIKEPYMVYTTVNPVAINNPFGMAWANILEDMIIDLDFFFIGGGIFAAIMAPCLFPDLLIYFGVLILIFILIGYRWYIIKICVQVAGCPIQFRLGQWDATIAAVDVDQVRAFMGDDLQFQDNWRNVRLMMWRRFRGNISPGPFQESRHLLVFGGPMSGKSRLGIGCTTEFAINERKCAYISLADLKDQDIRNINSSPWEGNYINFWNWPEAEVIVIDDIVDELASASFFNQLDQDPHRCNILFNNRRIIWVFNSEVSGFWLSRVNRWAQQAQEVQQAQQGQQVIGFFVSNNARVPAIAVGP